jgi:hypothetical protein
MPTVMLQSIADSLISMAFYPYNDHLSHYSFLYLCFLSKLRMIFTIHYQLLH